jgi:hypothetical protein
MCRDFIRAEGVRPVASVPPTTLDLRRRDVIEKTIENWHQYLRGDFPGGLDELLAEDVVFYSPIVYSPLKGKELTKLYLNAAGATLGGGDKKSDEGKNADEITFGYKKEILMGNHAMLEFETSVEGKYMNGVDIITCNDEGKIIEFKVMIRPLQAIQAVHRQMATMLEKMKSE